MRIERVLTLVDCHAEGEVGNVITGGVVDPPGATVLEKRDWVQRNADWLRTSLLFEPRGSAAHHANLLVKSTHPDAQVGYVIIEPTEYPAMSGSNTICVATVLLETGMIPMQEPRTTVTLEAPGGLISVDCECRDGKVVRASLVNQPAFAYHLDREIDVPGIGKLTVDVGWGGMTYAIVDAQALGFEVVPSEGRALCELGERIKRAAAEQLPVEHPTLEGMTGISQTLFAAPLRRTDDGLESHNAVVISPGRIDRSPCGTGTSARLAVLHAKGLIREGEVFRHSSIIGTTFEGTIEEEISVADRGGREVAGIVPRIAGQAWITGTRQVGVHPTDPFANGHTVSDLWFDMSTDHL